MATLSSNTTYTVPNKNGSYDGSMVVKQYADLTINAAVTVTVDQPCRGLAIFVQGDCTVGGHINMNFLGADRDPTSTSEGEAVDSSGLQYGIFKTGGTDTLSAIKFEGSLATGTGNPDGFAKAPVLTSGGGTTNFTTWSHPRVGGAGGAPYSSTSWASANQTVGTAGTGGQSGGGGTGAWGEQTLLIPDGGDGTCFSGGSGGGASIGTSSFGTAPSDYGGVGGDYQDWGSANHAAGGGAGHPAGTSREVGGWTITAPTGGGGGLLYLIVGGDLTISSGATLSANGGSGAGLTGNSSNTWRGCGGGGAGGGAIVLVSKGTYSNSGTVQAIGGIQSVSTGGKDSNTNGGAGGAGTVTTHTSSVR